MTSNVLITNNDSRNAYLCLKNSLYRDKTNLMEQANSIEDPVYKCKAYCRIFKAFGNNEAKQLAQQEFVKIDPTSYARIKIYNKFAAINPGVTRISSAPYYFIPPSNGGSSEQALINSVMDSRGDSCLIC